MKTRKDFIATVATVGAMCATGATPAAALAQEATPSPAAMATASPAPRGRRAAGPSELAKLFAARMRGFDPALTDEQIASIAGDMDFYMSLGSSINPKGKTLKNWDEPVTIFEVES